VEPPTYIHNNSGIGVFERPHPGVASMIPCGQDLPIHLLSINQLLEDRFAVVFTSDWSKGGLSETFKLRLWRRVARKFFFIANLS
jgi:hypothetical protein